MLKIRNDIPMPKFHENYGRPCIYPFASMKVGDSIIGEKKMQAAVSVYMRRYNRKGCFTIRKRGDNFVCWCIKEAGGVN